MSDQTPLEIVRLTPAGRGAVATLLVEGPGATDAVGRRFHAAAGRSLSSYSPGRLVFGHFDFGAPSREEVVVRVRTRQSLELHCHGGQAAVAALEAALVAEGGRTVAWQDWAAGHHPDPISAAARIALAEATTERAALVLLDQLSGALRRAVDSIAALLARHDATSATREIHALLRHTRPGRHLVDPWCVVLAGPPNVGKSSLINGLVGYQRVIVHAAPGTTRDVVTTRTAIDGWPVELSDTAGLWPLAEGPSDDDELEQAGIALAQDKLAAADLVVLVFELSRPWSPLEASLVREWPDALVVHNKRDLPEAPGPPRPAGLRTSALKTEGLDELLSAIAGRLVPEPPPAGAAVPFTAGQIRRLQSAVDALARGDLASARTAIEAMQASAEE